MRLTPDVLQTRELHSLYRKCHIEIIWRATHRHAVGKCKGCGNAYVKDTGRLGMGRQAPWTPIPRTAAARYIKQERHIKRDKIRRIVAWGKIAKRVPGFPKDITR